MRRLLQVLAPLLLLACSSASESGEVESSEGAATAGARAQLESYTGTWKLVVQPEDAQSGQLMPPEVTVVVTDNAVDPTTKETKGTRLRIMRADSPSVPAVDRAPFVNVDEGKGCENVKMGTASSVTVCHETVLFDNGKALMHTVTLTSYEAFVFPTGWSTAKQVLSLEDGELYYTYEIDGVPTSAAAFKR